MAKTILKTDKNEEEVFENKVNPWVVPDASVFLKYCCPECEFKNAIFQNFANHALMHHPNALEDACKLFLDENRVDLPNSEHGIKEEALDYDDNDNDNEDFNYSYDTHPNVFLDMKDVGFENCKTCGVLECVCFNDMYMDSKIKVEKKVSNPVKKKNKVGLGKKIPLCDLCQNSKLASRSWVVLHRREKHMKGKEFFCSYCDTKFLKFKKLKIHIDLLHPEKFEQKFSCIECKKQFIFECSLDFHKSSHHKKKTKKKHVCDICGYENFSSTSTGLKNHMIEKHDSEGATRLFCEICGFSTLTKVKLTYHKSLNHNPKNLKQCEYCDYKAKTNQNLYIHIDRKHQDKIAEKNYSCENCGKLFIFAQSLSDHHRGFCKNSDVKRPQILKKHICHICGYEACRKDSLDVKIFK